VRRPEAWDGVHAPGTRIEAPRGGRREIARSLQAPARGESEKPRGGPKLPLVRLDTHHGGLDPRTGRLDFPLFQSNQRHVRADQPQFQSAEQRGGLTSLRVRLNQRDVRLEMSVAESDAREFQSAEQIVRLNVTRVGSDVSEFESDVSQVESDELLVGPKERQVGLDVSEVRLNQPLVRLAVTQVGPKKPLFRLKQSHGGPKVSVVESDEQEIQSTETQFQSRARHFRLSDLVCALDDPARRPDRSIGAHLTPHRRRVLRACLR
jgi:hypothetical protein